MAGRSRRRALIAILLMAMAISFWRGMASDEGEDAAVVGRSARLTGREFSRMMELLPRAWSQQDTEAALSCFTADAVYIEPPDIQFFDGHAQLRPYFAALKPRTFMRFHNLWFDETRQVGAGEYSFGSSERPTALHGVVIVEVRDGRIAFWREYQRREPRVQGFLGP